MAIFMNNDESQGKLHQYSSISDRVLRVRIQEKNRRDHHCEYCTNTIPCEQGSVYVTGLNAGNFYSYHVHRSCYQ